MAKKKKAKRTQRQVLPSVDRHIMFYRIHCGTDDGGQPIAFNPTTALNHINGLDWSTTGRYMPSLDSGVTCAWVDQTTANQRMRLATVRRAGLPLVENGGGTLSGLTISANSGLAEITHLVFFPNNILGAVFNFYGPRPTRLSIYLKTKVPNTPLDLKVEPLIRANIVEQLDKLNTLRLVELRIRPSYAQIVQQANDSLGSAFAAATSAVTDEVKDVEIILRTGRKKSAHLGQSFLAFVKNLASRTDIRENANHFIVSGVDRETDQITKIDLLSDKLIKTKKIVRQSQRTRALDRDAAYAAIQEAYDELYNELEAAASLEV